MYSNTSVGERGRRGLDSPSAVPRRVVRLTRWVACGALTLIVIPLSVTSPAFAAPDPKAPVGAIALRLVDIPAAARNDPRAQVAVVDHLAPGSVIRRRVEVSNTTPSTVQVALYPAAAGIANGAFLGAVGRAANDLSSWMSVTPASSNIPPGKRVMATMTLSVPSDAAPGEQYAAVWAEARSPSADGGVVQVNRVGIRVYLSVGPGGPPAADFEIDSLTAARSPDGLPTVVASVQNIGGRALDMNGVLQLLAGPGGLSAGPFPASLGTTLAVGATEPVTIRLDIRIPDGPWDAQITLRSGLLERSASATITFPKAGVARPVKTTTATAGWLYPVIAVVTVLLFVGFAVLLFLKRRRRTATVKLQSPVPPQAPAAGREDRRRGAGSPATTGRPLVVADIAEGPTDLADRSLFEEATQSALTSCGGERLFLTLIHLDAVDQVANRFGHAGKAALLVTIAERLRRAVRPQDLVARLDSDNFAILFENVARSDVNAISRRMTMTVNQPLTIDGSEVRIQANVGMAQALSNDDASSLMGHAGAALAEAKVMATVTVQSHAQWYAETTEPRHE